MLYRTRIALAIKGDRLEAGTEVELTEQDFKQFDRNDFVAVSGEVVEPEPVEEKPVDKMTKAELEAKAESLGLSTSGTKADLIERITLNV